MNPNYSHGVMVGDISSYDKNEALDYVFLEF